MLKYITTASLFLLCACNMATVEEVESPNEIQSIVKGVPPATKAVRQKVNTKAKYYKFSGSPDIQFSTELRSFSPTQLKGKTGNIILMYPYGMSFTPLCPSIETTVARRHFDRIMRARSSYESRPETPEGLDAYISPSLGSCKVGGQVSNLQSGDTAVFRLKKIHSINIETEGVQKIYEVADTNSTSVFLFENFEENAQELGVSKSFAERIIGKYSGCSSKPANSHDYFIQSLECR